MVCSKIKDILEPIMDSLEDKGSRKGHYEIDVPNKRRVGIPLPPGRGLTTDVLH